MVRQYGNLSFTRVFGAGHEVPYYQPETAYEIFKRVMFNKDVASGKVSTARTGCDATTATKGPQSIAGVMNEMPAKHPQECYFWDMIETCTQEQISLAKKGVAVFVDFIMTGYDLGNGTVHHF
jgi:carboxypeptidase D